MNVTGRYVAHSSLMLVMIGCVSQSLLVEQQQSVRSSESDQQLRMCRAVAEAYSKNAAAESHLICRYSMKHGDAESTADAIAGKYHFRAAVDCSWIVHGAKTRLTMNVDSAQVEELRGLPEYQVVPASNEIAFREP